MNEEDFAPVSRDSIEIKTKWFLKRHIILAFGILLGSIFDLCLNAIINLTISPELSHDLFLMWQNIPINVWISVISFVTFIIVVYYFKLVKGDENI